jgi:hypothetical protein
MLKTTATLHDRRQGIVLLVVMAMLALFATVALSFVFYAESEATSARFGSQAQTLAQADAEPELLLSYFLSQLIYDTDNVYSSMRGHSLARGMYSYDPLNLNEVPFNGIGRYRSTIMNPAAGGTKKSSVAMINYTDFSAGGIAADAGIPQRSPETNTQTIMNAKSAGNIVTITTLQPHGFVKQQPVTVRGVPVGPYNGQWSVATVPSATTFTYNHPTPGLPPSPQPGGLASVYVAGNVSWTYPDLNNMFLGAVNGSGEVLMSSFQRPWLAVSNDPNDVWAKYLTLRPHPSYHDKFVSPDWDGNGDVKNLEWGLGSRNVTPPGGHTNNDSIWMDLGFPVLTAPNGKRYKALFAPLIIDLDNKINLYVHGNTMTNAGNNLKPPLMTQHASNQGWGPWEVNLSKVLHYGPGGANAEWLKLFRGSPIGRYGPDGTPSGIYASPLNTKATAPPPWYYSKIDYGGLMGRQLRSGIWKYVYFPGDTSEPGYNKLSLVHTYPDFPPNWDNAAPNSDDVKNQNSPVNNHPSKYNPLIQTGDDKIALVMSQIEALYRYRGTNSPALSSDLFQQLPHNMSNARTRWLSALRTMDLDKPGLLPYNWKDMTTLATASDYTFAFGFPTTAGAQFPPTAPPNKGEFDANGWRSKVYNATANEWRVKLSRDLPVYPDPSADTERWKMAGELYDMLISLTGARDPRKVPTMPTGTPEYFAARALAQLAVNIVDFIDEDDVITRWQWNPADGANGTVYGTEMPKVLLNEVYAQVDNDPSDQWLEQNDPATGQKHGSKYDVNFWVELHNPTQSSVPIPLQPSYQILVTKTSNFDPTSGKPISNVFPDLVGVASFPAGASIDKPNPAGPDFSYQTTLNKGFYFFGPEPPLPANKQFFGKDPTTGTLKYGGSKPTFPPTNGTSPGLSLGPVPFPAPAPNAQYCVLLQRLANPSLPFNLVTNPFVTVDYFDNVSLTAQLPGANPGTQTKNLGLYYRYGLDQNGMPPPTPDPNFLWASAGRKQPYASNVNKVNIVDVNQALAPSTVVTVTTATVHGFLKGQTITITGVNKNPGYNGNFLITSVKGTSFTYDPGVPLPPDLMAPVFFPSRAYAVLGNWAAQDPLPPFAPYPAPSAKTPHNTFMRHNGQEPASKYRTQLNTGPNPTLTAPFYWPVHMDRQLVNPLELLNVSCYAPWEYAQRFAAAASYVIPAPPGGATQAGNTVTITTQNQHGLTPGQTVTVSGVGVAGYNGTFTVAKVLTNKKFTYSTGPVIGLPASGGGNVTVSLDHRAPWDQQTTLLYRLLGSVYTKRLDGGSPGKRITGLINLNTIWDHEILDALVDNLNVRIAATIASAVVVGTDVQITTVGAHGFSVGDLVTISGVEIGGYNGKYVITAVTANTFTYAAPRMLPNSSGGHAVVPNSLFNLFMESRSPKVVDSGRPGPTDDIDIVNDGVVSTVTVADINVPFKSLDVGVYAPGNTQYPNGLGLQNTLLRNGVFQQNDLPVNAAYPAVYPAGHPFKKNEVLTKIFNNVTTRSNVFAVWLTVGFFEVVDESVLPVKLGAEIGRAENHHVRHRMFAIIDRTNLMTPDLTNTVSYSTGLATQVTKPGVQQVKLSQSGVFANATWMLTSGSQVQVGVKLRPGMSLEFADKIPANTETVRVQAVDYATNQITALFTKPHIPGSVKVNPVFTAPTPVTVPGSVGLPPSKYGNPGPQDGLPFDLRKNALVVPYFSIIQ